MSDGVIYYNHGRGALLRLAVSLHSLRKVYSGSITILAHGPGVEECKGIAELFNTSLIYSKLPDSGRKTVYLNKCLYHTETPYDTTIAIDNDTVVLRSDFTDLFSLANTYDFVVSQFATWGTSRGQIKSRIIGWKKFYPHLIDGALAFGKAINCGVIAFRKNSSLMHDWYKLAEVGRNTSFIPDETCCQVILQNYPHYIAGTSFNTSCKYGILTPETRILHFHGRKHCRIENGQYKYNSDIWYKNFEEIKYVSQVVPLIQHDKYLKEFHSMHDVIRLKVAI